MDRSVLVHVRRALCLFNLACIVYWPPHAGAAPVQNRLQHFRCRTVVAGLDMHMYHGTPVPVAVINGKGLPSCSKAHFPSPAPSSRATLCFLPGVFDAVRCQHKMHFGAGQANWE